MRKKWTLAVVVVGMVMFLTGLKVGGDLGIRLGQTHLEMMMAQNLNILKGCSLRTCDSGMLKLLTTNSEAAVRMYETWQQWLESNWVTGSFQYIILSAGQNSGYINRPTNEWKEKLRRADAEVDRSKGSGSN